MASNLALIERFFKQTETAPKVKVPGNYQTLQRDINIFFPLFQIQFNQFNEIFKKFIDYYRI